MKYKTNKTSWRLRANRIMTKTWVRFTLKLGRKSKWRMIGHYSKNKKVQLKHHRFNRRYRVI